MKSTLFYFLYVKGSALFFAYLHQLFPEIFSGEQPQKRLNRLVEAVGDILGVLNLAIP